MASLAASAAPHALNVSRQVAANRRPKQRFLFGRIEAGHSEKREIGLADQRRLAPEANHLRGAAPGEMRNDHAVDAAGRRGGGRIEIRVAIDINHADVAIIAAQASHGGQRDRAIAG